MAISLNHRALSALAKLETSDLKHAQRLQLFATTLGFGSGAALMDRARADDPLPEAALALVRRAAEMAGRGRSGVSLQREILGLIGEGDMAAPENVLTGEPVMAAITSDDHRVCVHVDAREWLLSLSDGEVRDLVLEDYNRGFMSDALYEYTVTHHPEVVDDLTLHLAALSRIGSDEYGYHVELEESQVVPFLAAHRPDPHGAMESMVEDGLIDADLGALRGEPASERNDVLITVTCQVARDDLDPEDQDPDGDDAIGGHYRYTILSDAPISESLAYEKALDAYHDDYAIAVLDNYSIVTSVFTEENAPDELIDHGTIEVDAPSGYSGSPSDADDGPSPM